MNLSIVIPHHNRIDCLIRCLKEAAPLCPLYIVRTGGSFAHNCNKAFQMVDTEHVMFLNDDVLLDTMFINYRSYDFNDITGISSLQNGKIIRGVEICPNLEWPFKETESSPHFPLASCFVIRSKIFRELGMFDEAYRNGCEDIELFLKAMECGIKFSWLDIPVMHLYAQSEGRGKHIQKNREILLNRFPKERLERILENYDGN